MPLELYIYGPAFSLPSIDAQCIAAVAYLTQAVPRGEWVLVAGSDPSLSPTKELPVLRNENTWIGGFRDIVDYVKQYSGGRWCLDTELEGREKADCIAFSSFVEAHGQPLLDLSLYVSTQNYTTVTRPLYSSFQPFPLPYFIPSSIRSSAKARTAHLGLSSIDIDSDPSQSKEDSNPIPPSLRKPQTTISSLLSANPETTAQIRLDALATAFFKPLQSLRNKKRFFVASFPTSLDCLALAYLSLALLPDLPSPWLATCMRTRYPHLCAFVHDLQRSWFNGSVTLEDAYLTLPSSSLSSLTAEEAEKEQERRRRAHGKAALPWKEPDRGSLVALGRIVANEIADSLPVISHLRYAKRLKKELESEAEDDEEREDAREVVGVYRKEVWVTTASVIGSVGLLVGYMAWYGLLGNLLGGVDEDADGDGDGDADGDGNGDGDPGQGKKNTEQADTMTDSGGLAQYGDAGAALEVLAQKLDLNVDGSGASFWGGSQSGQTQGERQTEPVVRG